ncbi:hypothetical protein TNIN_63331 [Trichonephila inaurata madagascariensis]|uniref:Uncharacterized protein n=1 Tax=Trichonephila inaurata madagascariensis TaxID=2747483 RepID=A0A8X6II58_9ARAC|nr:hypothetical protein TNIN_63331 [Trichonephila inaurata madagascariensis]
MTGSILRSGDLSRNSLRIDQARGRPVWRCYMVTRQKSPKEGLPACIVSSFSLLTSSRVIFTKTKSDFVKISSCAKVDTKLGAFFL